MKFTPCLLAAGAFVAQTAFCADYHLDSQSGDDSHEGTSAQRAWKSLERANREVFKPGDRLLLKAGTRYSGQLKPQGSGTEETPIRIDKYGDGGLPRIDGEGKFLDALLLRNIEFWQIQNLEITNQGEKPVPWRTGVHILAENFGKMRHIRLNRLYVHDVNGDLRKTHEGCGIYFESKGKATPSHFDDLLIENCKVVRVDRNGICQKGGGKDRSLRVVIRKNVLEDIGGDGIKPWGSNAPLVEYNVVRGGRMRAEDAAAGIWPFACDDALIQFNEVSGMKGTIDGQGFDSDYLCRRSIFQYNYSHDNEGGFMLICSPGESYNEDTIIRYNISQNDGIPKSRVFQFGGNPSNTLIHNNTIYIGPKQKDVPMFSFNAWNGGIPGKVKFFNNVVYVDGSVTYTWGPAKDVEFANNIFHGKGALPKGATSLIESRPPLRSPGAGKDGFASLAGYTPQSAKFPRGQVILNNGGRDFVGNPVPANSPPTVGAVEVK